METTSRLKTSWIALAIKGGKLVFPLLIKLGTVLVKLLKSGSMLKLGLAMTSFGVYAVLLDPRFAILLMVTLALHETGHVLMMRRFGMVTRGFYFVPLIGGAAVAESAFSSAWNEASVALAGPAVGLLTALVPFALYQVTGEPVFEVAACWIAFMNLLNLLPVHPLDGGRVLRALGMGLTGNRGLLLFAAVTATGIVYCMRNGYMIFVMFGILGFGEELGRRVRNSRGDRSAATRNQRANHRFFRVRLVEALGLPEGTNRLDVIQRAVEAWQNDPANAACVNGVTELIARDEKNRRDGIALTDWHFAVIPQAASHWDRSPASAAFFKTSLEQLADSFGKNPADVFQELPSESVAAFRLFYDRNAMGPFVGYHTACRTDAELAFAPREAAAAIIGYAALVAILFKLMSATGGHEAASHAVSFFRGL